MLGTYLVSVLNMRRRMCSVLLSVLPAEMLQRALSQYHPWGTPHVTGLQLDFQHWPQFLECDHTAHSLFPECSVRSMSLQHRDQDVIWDSGRCFLYMQVDDVSCSFLVRRHCDPTTEATKSVRHNLPLVKPYWLSPITSSSSMCLSAVSRKICPMTGLGTEVRLTGL